MSKYLKTATFAINLLIAAFIFNMNASGQLLINEIEADPGNQQNDSCQYVELRGTPGATVAANTWVVSFDSDSANPGFLSLAVNIGGQVVGSNGTITLINTLGGTCPNRTFSAGTNLINYFSTQRIGGANINVGSESFAILNTATALAPGQDRDPDDDGELNFTATFIDAVSFLINPDEQVVYPSNSPILGTPFADVPDALVRFPGNNTPFSGDAFYWGEVADVPEEAVALIAPLSPNFPAGGVLSPGTPNGTVAAPRKTVADFNGDGKTDYSITRANAGELTWWSAINGTTETRTIRWGLSGDVPVAEDFDGDAKDDVAVWRPAAATIAAFYILRSTDSTVEILQFGQNGDDPALTGDWDGDGKADVAVYREGAAGQQSIFYYRATNGNAGGAITFIPWGSGGDRAVRGNFDGDSKQDAAVFRPSNNSWYILQSSNSQLSTIPFGLSGDVKVSGDFDGDQKTDLAVFRSGVWYVLQSSNSQVRIVNFGAAGDSPVAGDYNGDGSADFAVWRNGTFYVQSSIGGAVTYFNWGIAGDQAVAGIFNN